MTIANELRLSFTSRLRPENARRKGYLGMSMIGGCPTAAYDSFMGTREADMRLMWYGFAGGNYENGIRDLLRVSRGCTLVPRSHYLYHIEASFDARYRGHADIILVGPRGETTVIDVKSLDWRKFKDLLDGKLPYSHDKNLIQVQAYMNHGDFDHGGIIYTPRDIPHGAWEEEALNLENDPMPFKVVDIPYDIAAFEALDEHALQLLEMIDKNERPDCTCGWCRQIVSDDEVPF